MKKVKNFKKVVNEFKTTSIRREGYTPEELADILRKNDDSYDFFVFYDKDESQCMDEFSKALIESLDLSNVVHFMAIDELKGLFTTQQLCCIFQAFNGIQVDWGMSQFNSLKSEVFDYIECFGRDIYDLGDIEEFENKINSIHPITFNLFVSMIIMSWNIIGKNKYSSNNLLKCLKSD